MSGIYSPGIYSSGIYSYGMCRSLFRARAVRATILGYFKKSFAVHWTVTVLILPGLISCGKDSAVLQATASIQAPVLNEGARENSNEESSILPGVPGPEEVLNRAAKSPSDMIAVLSRSNQPLPPLPKRHSCILI